MRFLLDTNLPIDVLLDRPGLADESLAVIERAAELGAEMFIAWHGLATAYYLLRRGRPEEKALAGVDQILAWAQVAPVEDADARRARTLGCPDFEDALQITSAEACGADLIVTRDTNDFKASSIPAITPAEFLARFPVAQRRSPDFPDLTVSAQAASFSLVETTLNYAETHLSRLLELVAKGEEVVLHRDGVAVAKIVPISSTGGIRPRVGEITSAPVQWTSQSFAALDEDGMKELGFLP